MISSKKIKEIKFELRPSKVIIGQVGLFALKDFHKNEIIVSNDYWDESVLVGWDEFNNLPTVLQEKLINFCYKDEKGIYAPEDFNKLNLAYFFNHSCEPNSFSDEDGNYIAMIDIKKDQEFTIDVEKLMKKTVSQFECHCGSGKCRKIIKI